MAERVDEAKADRFGMGGLHVHAMMWWLDIYVLNTMLRSLDKIWMQDWQ